MRRRYWHLLGLASTILLILTPFLLTQAENLFQPARLAGYKVYFTDTNGEASRYDRSQEGLSRLNGLLQQLNAEVHSLEWNEKFPADADLVIVAGPTNEFSSEQLMSLWSYLNRGGRVLFLANPLHASPVFAAESDLFGLFWSDAGVRGRNDTVVMATGLMPIAPEPVEAPAPEETEAAEATEEIEPTDPLTPPEIEITPAEAPTLSENFSIASVNQQHPITSGLQGDLSFFGVRSLELQETPHGFEPVSLVSTGEGFYSASNFRQYLDTGVFPTSLNNQGASGLTLAAALTNPTTQSRLVIVGDREFATNGGGLQTFPPASASFVHAENARFLLNSIAWLLDVDPGMVNIPLPTADLAGFNQEVTPTAQVSPVEQLPTATPPG